MGGTPLKEDWRCVKKQCGGQSVTICGAQGAHLLCAGNSGSVRAKRTRKNAAKKSSLIFYFTGDRGYYVNTFSEGAGPILLSNVNCTGSEEELAECPSVGVFEHLCIHREDVRIVCIPSATPPGVYLHAANIS